MMNRLIGYVIAIATAITTYWIFYFLASFFGSENPHFIASAITVAMVIHESAHLISLEMNKVPATMFFLVIIGGALPIPGHESKFKRLSWERQASIILAGTIGNFAVILGTYVFSQCGYITHNDFLRIMDLNGTLVLWNLFPLLIFDGGRFAKLLFNSISEDRDMKYTIALAVGFFVPLVILLIIYGKLSFFHFWFFSLGLHWEASHDKPYGSEDPKAIPKSHQKWWAVLFLTMILVGAIIVSITPSWL